MRRAALALALALLGAACSSAEEAGQDAPAAPARDLAEGGEPSALALRVGQRVPAAQARKPRFDPARLEVSGFRALPDGDLADWDAAKLGWESIPPLASAQGHRGAADLSARMALASYRSGLSFAVRASDDRRVEAVATSVLRSSDHVVLELWPGGGDRELGDELQRALGTRIELGTVRKLVRVTRPAEQWRAEEISAMGAATADGYVVEARLPLAVLAPLPRAVVEELRYRVTIHDADEEGEGARPKLQREGSLTLRPPLEVPEAVRLRVWNRICRATYDRAVWMYENGWRCGVPYSHESVQVDDTRAAEHVRLAEVRIPEPPRVVWIRERLLFVNMLGLGEGLAALLDRNETILSVLRLGVVGAQSPGDARAKDSGAEVFRLPDGTFAVAVVHARPAEVGPLGGRCAAGHRVFLSILALRECYKSTPAAPAPEPRQTPHVEEVFRMLLEDCDASRAADWTMSRDRTTIRVHNSLAPARPETVYRYEGGTYRRQVAQEGSGQPR